MDPMPSTRAMPLPKLEALISKVWSDPGFHERLENAPEECLSELGITLPKGASIHIGLNQASSEVYESNSIFIPAPPSRSRVIDEDVFAAAGYSAGKASRITFIECTECCKTQGTSNYCCKG